MKSRRARRPLLLHPLPAVPYFSAHSRPALAPPLALGGSFPTSVGTVVGKRVPPLQSHEFEWVRDWVRVTAALHHAIDKVEKPSLDGIRHHDPDRQKYQSSSHLFPSSLFCFLVLANQRSLCGYSLPTLLKTKPPFL